MHYQSRVSRLASTRYGDRRHTLADDCGLGLALAVDVRIFVHNCVEGARYERAQVLKAALKRISAALLSDPVHAPAFTHRLRQAHGVPGGQGF